MSEDTLAYADIASPVGNLRIFVSAKGLRRLDSSARRPAPPRGAEPDAPSTAKYVRALERYFAGDRRALDALPLDVVDGTPFQRKVWDALRTIPYGETRSYAWLAGAVGKPGAARAVGQANGANPVGIVVPCHRVVAADGTIGGYAGGLPMKRALLALEQGKPTQKTLVAH